MRPLLSGFLYFFLATGVLVVLLRLIWLAYGAALRKLEEWSHRTGDFRLQRAVLMTPPQVQATLAGAVKMVRAVLVLILLYFYVPVVLSVVPFTGGWGRGVLAWVLDSVARIGLSIIAYLPNLVYLLFVLLIVRYIMKLIRFVLDAVQKRDIVLPGFEPEWAPPTYKLARFVAVILTMVICYPLLPGAQSEVFKGFSIFVGALVTIGSSSVIGNVISGIVLTYTRSFRAGDRVKIGNTVGDVLEKTLFVTRVRTIKNEEVTIPNGVVLAGRIMNYSAAAGTRGLILHTAVGIGYDVDWRQVHELLLGAAAKTEGLLEDPKPFVWQSDLGDYAITYELNAYTRDTKSVGRIYSDLRRNILDAFNGARIEIMTPAVTALRDGNQPAIPSEDHGQAPRFPGFRFWSAGEKAE